jgi:hypothetical protein
MDMREPSLAEQILPKITAFPATPDSAELGVLVEFEDASEIRLSADEMLEAWWWDEASLTMRSAEE